MSKKNILTLIISAASISLVGILGVHNAYSTQNCSTDSNTGVVTCTNSATASVTVSSACSFKVTRSSGYDSVNGYSGTLVNGASSEITGSTFTTTCNDPGGYALYAIGYSNNTLGNTDLIFNNTANSPNNIKTDDPENTGSNWKMKLTIPSGNNTAPNYVNPTYDNTYGIIPSSYTKIASLDTVTDSTSGSSDTQNGSSIVASYQATASSTQPAGTYTGAVKYTMVHPNTNIPNQPYNCNSNSICYFPNAGNLVADTMGNQGIEATDTSATLWASNFQRAGYGFAGWSDTYDYEVNTGSESNSSAHIYGPNQTIEFTAGQYSGTDSGLSLYAVWVEPAKSSSGAELTFQTTNLLSTTLADNSTLSSKPTGYVTALRDRRDGQVYAVAKLADGNYWMIENLRLEAEYTRGDYYKGLAQGYGTSSTYGNFIGLANPETDFDTTANSIYSTDDSTEIFIGNDRYASQRMPRYNNINTHSTVSSMSSVDSNIYSYGNYYTWPAAIASTIQYRTAGEIVTTSICPTNWHIPYGLSSSNGSFGYLNTQIGLSGAAASNAWRSYPINLVYAGEYYSSDDIDRRGTYGSYLSSTSAEQSAAGLSIANINVTAGGNGISKFAGAALRCIIGN